MRFRTFPSFTAFLLNVQYTIGYVAAGFLVSVPIQLLWTIYQSHSGDQWGELWGSLGRGLLCLAGYFIFWPILRYYDWGNMKLPEFKLFELVVTRNAALVSLVWLLLSFLYPQLGSPQMLWLLFLLEAIAYAKIKAHTLIFREFYDIELMAHRREWYDELSHGLRVQARGATAELRVQAREVQGQLRNRVRRLARWMGAGVAGADVPEDTPKPVILGPMPCRYQNRFHSGRLVIPATKRSAPNLALPPASNPPVAPVPTSTPNGADDAAKPTS